MKLGRRAVGLRIGRTVRIASLQEGHGPLPDRGKIDGQLAAGRIQVDSLARLPQGEGPPACAADNGKLHLQRLVHRGNVNARVLEHQRQRQVLAQVGRNRAKQQAAAPLNQDRVLEEAQPGLASIHTYAARTDAHRAAP